MQLMHNGLGRRYWLSELLFCAFCGITLHAQTIAVTPLHVFALQTEISDPICLTAGRSGGVLYGTTHLDQTNGTVFTINTDGSGYAVLHTFADSETTFGDPGTGFAYTYVTEGSDGRLYGTVPSGGAFGYGAVFRLNANGSGYTVIHDFTSITESSPASLMQARDGAFYGAGNSIFKVNADGGNYSVLYHFTNGLDGGTALGVLQQGADGTLYGTSFVGGTNGFGTIFSVTTNGANFKVLHAFALGDGANPVAGLIQGSDGALYGTTSNSGTNGFASSGGTIFKLDTNGNNFQVLHTFTGSPSDGDVALSGLVEGLGKFLYGTTYLGGNSGGGFSFGIIFRIGMDGSGYNPLYYFTNSAPSGSQPLTGLVKGAAQGNTGVLYGTTSHGVSPNAGAIFAAIVNPSLSITPAISQTASNQTAVFWPAWAANYVLQSTTNIASSNWVNVADGVPVYGVQVTSTNPAVFYRLVSP